MGSKKNNHKAGHAQGHARPRKNEPHLRLHFARRGAARQPTHISRAERANQKRQYAHNMRPAANELSYKASEFADLDVHLHPDINLGNAPETFSEATLHTTEGKHEKNAFVVWQLAASTLLGLSGYFAGVAHPHNAENEFLHDPTGRLGTGALNSLRLGIWFTAHEIISRMDRTDIEKDVLRARVNTIGFGTGMAAYLPQFFGGLNSEEGPINGDTAGAGLTLGAYLIGMLRQARVSHRLNNFRQYFPAAELTRDQREEVIGASFNNQKFENYVFKWGMSSLLIAKGLSFVAKGGHGLAAHFNDHSTGTMAVLAAGAALLASGACFTQSGWHEMWRYNSEHIKGHYNWSKGVLGRTWRAIRNQAAGEPQPDKNPTPKSRSPSENQGEQPGLHR